MYYSLLYSYDILYIPYAISIYLIYLREIRYSSYSQAVEGLTEVVQVHLLLLRGALRGSHWAGALLLRREFRDNLLHVWHRREGEEGRGGDVGEGFSY